MRSASCLSSSASHIFRAWRSFSFCGGGGLERIGQALCGLGLPRIFSLARRHVFLRTLVSVVLVARFLRWHRLVFRLLCRWCDFVAAAGCGLMRHAFGELRLQVDDRGVLPLRFAFKPPQLGVAKLDDPVDVAPVAAMAGRSVAAAFGPR